MFRIGTLAALGALLGAMTLTTAPAQAARGGGGGTFILGLGGGVVSNTQEHMNTLITRANTRANGITSGQLNQSYEGAVQIGYRFSGSMIAALLRPSLTYQSATGGNAAGQPYNYKVMGMTLFPMLRLYPLENDLMRFFMQFGIGYGRTSGTIEEADAKVEFSGGAYGTVAGLGAEFCYEGTHCFTLEGNYRYMTVERNISDSTTGTFASGSVSQVAQNQEVEMDGTDLATRLGGTQFLLGYSFYF